MSADVHERFSTTFSQDLLKENPDMRASASERQYSFVVDSEGWRIDELRGRANKSPGKSLQRATSLGMNGKCYMYTSFLDAGNHASGGMIAALPIPPYTPLMFGYRAGMRSLANEMQTRSVSDGGISQSPTFGSVRELRYETQKEYVTVKLAQAYGLFPISIVFRQKTSNPNGYTEQAFEVDKLEPFGSVQIPVDAHWEYRAVVLGDVASRTRAVVHLDKVKVNDPGTRTIDYSLPVGVIFTDRQTGEEFMTTASGILEHIGWQGRGATAAAWLFIIGVTCITVLLLYLGIARFSGSRGQSPQA